MSAGGPPRFPTGLHLPRPASSDKFVREPSYETQNGLVYSNRDRVGQRFQQKVFMWGNPGLIFDLQAASGVESDGVVKPITVTLHTPEAGLATGPLQGMRTAVADETVRARIAYGVGNARSGQEAPGANRPIPTILEMDWVNGYSFTVCAAYLKLWGMLKKYTGAIPAAAGTEWMILSASVANDGRSESLAGSRPTLTDGQTSVAIGNQPQVEVPCHARNIHIHRANLAAGMLIEFWEQSGNVVGQVYFGPNVAMLQPVELPNDVENVRVTTDTAVAGRLRYVWGLSL